MADITDPAEIYFKDGIWGWDTTLWRQLIADVAGHLQVDVVASGLPAGGATAANQTTMITALQLIDDLQNALASVATDRLRVEIVSEDYVHVRDSKAQNTNGGTFTSGAWQTRDLTEEVHDTAGICALAANQITLEAGTYRCIISAPAHQVNRHQTRLQNITDGTTLITGTNEYSWQGQYYTTRSFIVGRFTLPTQKILEVQHRCLTTFVNQGFGVLCNWTEEIYTIAEFWRLVV